ncbi:hypothetical protein F895_03497 [Acinetobacter sp. CIP 64.2]|uniref:hypothetical protein n=1 Tax=Acinetobacter sp. CIP 64.2 TaxID=1217694 RepID=UPI0002CE0711|nr:hypothetical protein [Acinetobacter sp. CIP 64.2]ENX11992.1 hypothetical protein F895_03497 [Acinetobacter sp. CIP 64.2]
MAEQGKPLGTLKTAPAQLQTIKVVAIGNDQLDPQDKEVICKAICYCEPYRVCRRLFYLS